MQLPHIPPYKTKVIEPLYFRSREERQEKIREVHYNLFNLHSDWVIIDMITDSGTGAMSEHQWAEIMIGDESYAGSESYFKLARSIQKIMGYDYVIPTHQGRAAENILFSAVVKEGDVIPGNAHFDTTKGHIEMRKATALDLTIAEAYDTSLSLPFKGNIDLERLEQTILEYGKDRIPFINITVTCNTVAYFIKTREAAYKDHSIQDIVKLMFKHVSVVWMSAKKDGIVNIGGFLALRDQKLYEELGHYTIIYEGYLTYGGMSGRAMGALAVGLHEAIDYDYLHDRYTQVSYLGEQLKNNGIPIQEPVGGHAIYIDAMKALPNIPQNEYPAQVLGVGAYLAGGIRGVEIGTLLADRDPETGEDRLAELELLRLAVPRRVYSLQHMDYVAAAVTEAVRTNHNRSSGYRITRQANLLRHFTVELDEI